MLSRLELASVSLALPQGEVTLADQWEQFGGDVAQLGRIQATVGLDKRRVAAPGQTAFDLGEGAAREALRLAQVDAGEVEAVIFITQTPDHPMPGNATLLQARLGVPAKAGALDVNLGCSGFVYGLWLGGMMLETGLETVLLVVGDTLSRLVGSRDRAVAPVFGDGAGAAVLKWRKEPSAAHFILGADGCGAEHLCVPAGGMRQPRSAQTSEERVDEAGNWRSAEDLFMAGGEIFNFALRVAPKVAAEVMASAGWQAEEVDWLLLHQANNYIHRNITRRLKFPAERAPGTHLSRYGNLSAASIPALFCDELQGRLQEPSRVVMVGFGVGLSWGAAALTLGPNLPTGRIEI